MAQTVNIQDQYLNQLRKTIFRLLYSLQMVFN